MSASGFVGRVGGLAVFLGVGVALATGCGVAAADAGSSDSSSSSPGKPANSNSAHSSPSSKSSASSKQASRASASSAAATSASVAKVSTPVLDTVDAQTSSTASGKRNSRGAAALTDLSSSTLTTSENSNTAARRAGVTPGPITAALSALSVVATAPAPASAASVVSTPSPLTTMPTLQSMPSLTAAATTTTRVITLDAVSLAISLVAASAISTAVSVVTFAAPSPTTATPNLVLNGYSVVASSTEKVTSFYGKLGYTPGNPSLIQGQQQFDVVDPKTGASVGTFDALVSRGNGYPYTQLIVTANDGGTDVGTGPGQVPPVGSMISNFKLVGFGLSYSAMPSPSGDVVTVKLLTPFFDIPLPISFNAAAGIADHTVDNRPVQLANGYYIAPADPNGETLTGSTGFLPLFGAVQGNQKFNVYDSNNNVVGSFDGEFTTTSDLLGIYTQAILVTSTDSGTVGTDPGEVPPVGSVYNVYYHGSDDKYLLYSSLPSSPFDVISLISVTPDRITKSTLTLLDASTPPFTPTLSAPGGKTFVPIDDSFQPSGVNGLPPREVEIQGYQQFVVYDSAGAPLGTVDADVFRQWDLLNVQTEALLITGSTGTGDVPPVGSVFNFVYFGKTGFGTAHSVTPSTSGDIISLKLLTPLFDIPLYSFRRPVNDRIPVDFYNPFAP